MPYIAYESCPANGGGTNDFPVSNIREASSQFLRIKQNMREQNDDASQGHFLKVSSVDKDDDGKITKIFEAYESDCAHTRP